MKNDPRDDLLSKVDEITDVWVRDVRRKIASSHDVAMTYEAIYHRLPLIIEAIAAQLPSQVPAASASRSAQKPDGAISPEKDFLKDNPIPVELGFDIAEVLRELSMLRTLVLTVMKTNLGTEDISQAISDFRKVDDVLNDIAARATERYAEYRLERVEPMHRALLSSNQELVRLVQAQKDNASHLAHELKNPLHSIISFSSLLLRKKRTDSTSDAAENSSANKEVKQLERIYENGQQISQLIGNMLEASRKEYLQSALNIEFVDITELVEKVIGSLRSKAIEKEIALTADCELAPPQVNTDALRLQQIIVNLVSNAIRYTEEGAVLVRCYGIDDQCWAIAVHDTGKGIDPAYQKEIFTPYFRVGTAASYLPESSGLGLTIVSKLVELLNGKIELASTLGEGSTFTVTLPLEVDIA